MNKILCTQSVPQFSHPWLSPAYVLLRCCEISHFHVMAVQLLPWSLLLQRSFSWLWYIVLADNWVWCTLTHSCFFLSLGQLLSHSHPQSLKSVSSCVTQPLSWHSYDLFTVASVLLPLWYLDYHHTAGHHTEFPNCPQNWFFFSFWMTAHTYSRMSPISDINMKWQRCQKGLHAERSRPTFSPPVNISYLFPTHLSLTEHRRLPKYQSSQLSHFLSVCRCVSLKSMVTLAQSRWCIAKIMKVSQNFHCCHGNKCFT